LNLCSQPNKGIIDCYSPAQVVKAREYQEEKEALKAAKEEAKLQRKIKRAANTLKNKLEREKKAKETAEKKAKAAREKEAKERAAAAKKTPKKQADCTVLKAKNAASTMPKGPKALLKVKAPVPVSTQYSIVVPDPRVVAIVVRERKTATRKITLP
jgi:ATPase subunit of ABC transporter with duplicated ATPase domains